MFLKNKNKNYRLIEPASLSGNNLINIVKKINIKNKEVFLVDYENTAMLPHKLFINKNKSVCFVFLNDSLSKRLNIEIKENDSKTTICSIFISPDGKNYLDIGLAYFLENTHKKPQVL